MLPLCIRLLLTVIVVYSSPNEMHTCSIYIFLDKLGSEKKRDRRENTKEFISACWRSWLSTVSVGKRKKKENFSPIFLYLFSTRLFSFGYAYFHGSLPEWRCWRINRGKKKGASRRRRKLGSHLRSRFFSCSLFKCSSSSKEEMDVFGKSSPRPLTVAQQQYRSLIPLVDSH